MLNITMVKKARNCQARGYIQLSRNRLTLTEALCRRNKGDFRSASDYDTGVRLTYRVAYEVVEVSALSAQSSKDTI